MVTSSTTLLNAQQAADRLGVSRKTLQSLYLDGQLRVVRFGRSVRISEEDLAEFIDRHRTGGGAKD